jgi:hypothetical protein
MPDLPPAHTARPGDFVACKASLNRIKRQGGLNGDAPWWKVVSRLRDGRLEVWNAKYGYKPIEPVRYSVVHRPDDL